MEVEGFEVLPCKASERLVVAGNAGEADLRMVEGEVDDGDAVPHESADESVCLRVAAQGDERTVSAPPAREARETVDDREVPAVRTCEPGDALMRSGYAGWITRRMLRCFIGRDYTTIDSIISCLKLQLIASCAPCLQMV